MSRRAESLITAARAQRLDDEGCTFVYADIRGAPQTIAISNDAIAQYRKKPGAHLMVEECSDFVHAHRAKIIDAAAKALARRGKVDGRILLFSEDLVTSEGNGTAASLGTKHQRRPVGYATGEQNGVIVRGVLPESCRVPRGG